MNVRMQQLNAGSNSEILSYKEGFKLSDKMFRQALFHELMHAPSVQESLYGLLNTGRKLKGSVYDPDPKTYYDSANKTLTRSTSSITTASKNSGSGVGYVPPPDQYEKGYLHEGNVNDWYPREVLRKLKAYY